jgi:hypothetical protein
VLRARLCFQYLDEHSALDLAASAKFVIDSVTYFCPWEYR